MHSKFSFARISHFIRPSHRQTYIRSIDKRFPYPRAAIQLADSEARPIASLITSVGMQSVVSAA
jgi:hypothetical protein